MLHASCGGYRFRVRATVPKAARPRIHDAQSRIKQRRLQRSASSPWLVASTMRFLAMTSKQANLHKTGIDFDLASAQESGNTFAGLSRSF
jgi:hypothetical protein